MGNLKHYRKTTSKHPGVKFGDKWKEGKAKTKKIKLELNLAFLVSNGKSDHSVLKFKEQHTSDAVVAQSYSEHASQDMT